MYSQGALRFTNKIEENSLRPLESETQKIIKEQSLQHLNLSMKVHRKRQL